MSKKWSGPVLLGMGVVIGSSACGTSLRTAPDFEARNQPVDRGYNVQQRSIAEQCRDPSFARVWAQYCGGPVAGTAQQPETPATSPHLPGRLPTGSVPGSSYLPGTRIVYVGGVPVRVSVPSSRSMGPYQQMERLQPPSQREDPVQGMTEMMTGWELDRVRLNTLYQQQYRSIRRRLEMIENSLKDPDMLTSTRERLLDEQAKLRLRQRTYDAAQDWDTERLRRLVRQPW